MTKKSNDLQQKSSFLVPKPNSTVRKGLCPTKTVRVPNPWPDPSVFPNSFWMRTIFHWHCWTDVRTPNYIRADFYYSRPRQWTLIIDSLLTQTGEQKGEYTGEKLTNNTRAERRTKAQDELWTETVGNGRRGGGGRWIEGWIDGGKNWE